MVARLSSVVRPAVLVLLAAALLACGKSGPAADDMADGSAAIDATTCASAPSTVL